MMFEAQSFDTPTAFQVEDDVSEVVAAPASGLR